MAIVPHSLLPVLLAREIALSAPRRRPFPRAMALLLLRVKSAHAILPRATATPANQHAPLATANLVVKQTGLAMVSGPQCRAPA